MDLFSILLETLVLFLGVKTLSSALEFNKFGSLPRLIAGDLGDFSLGDIGGDNEECLLRVVLLVALGVVGIGRGGGEDFGDSEEIP